MASDPQKTGLLFKEFAGKVNARQDQLFTQPGNKYPFRNYVLNNEIFSNDIPDDLGNISFVYGGGFTVYGLAALDASFASIGQTLGISYEIPGTDLVYYYKALLQDATPGSTPVRTWYIGDPSGSTNSLLRDSIAFSYDPSFNSYIPSLWNNAGSLSIPYYSATGGQIYWLMDYKSGFVELYGSDSDLSTWYTNNGSPPRISFITYDGPKGAAGASGGSVGVAVGESTAGVPGATQDVSFIYFDDADFDVSFGTYSATITYIGSASGDASFNNVDISGTLTVSGDASFNNIIAADGSFVNLTVDNDLDTRKLVVDTSASFPQNTIIVPKQRVSSGRTGFPMVQSYYTYNINSTYISTGDWFTIARVGRANSASNIRADAVFNLSSTQSGVHQSLTFFATHKFGRGNAINILQNDWYGGAVGFSGIRVAYNEFQSTTPHNTGTYDGAALQVRVGSTSSQWPMVLYISQNDEYYGWDPVFDVCANATTFLIPDNAPVCITDTSRNGLPFDDLSSTLVVDLDWNPSGNQEQRANQITTNPIRTQSYLSVYGDADISGSVEVSGNLLVKGMTDICGGLVVHGPTELFGPTTAHDNLHVIKDVLVDGSVNVHQDLIQRDTNFVNYGFTDVSLSTQSSLSGDYFKIAEVDYLRYVDPSKNNFAFTTTIGEFQFRTYPNWDIQGYDAANKFAQDVRFIATAHDNIINSDRLVTFNVLSAARNTNSCPFYTFEAFGDQSAKKITIYGKYNNLTNYSNKSMHVECRLFSNNRNYGTVNGGTNDYIIDWQIDPSLSNVGQTPSGTSTGSFNLIDDAARAHNSFSLNTASIIGESDVYAQGYNLIHKEVFQPYVSLQGGSSKPLAYITGFMDNNIPVETRASGTFLVSAREEQGATARATQEIIFYAQVTAAGKRNSGVNFRQNAVLTVLSNSYSPTTDFTAEPMVKKIEIYTSPPGAPPAGTHEINFYIYLDASASYLECSILNNKTNTSASANAPNFEYVRWIPNDNLNVGTTALGTALQSIDLSDGYYSHAYIGAEKVIFDGDSISAPNACLDISCIDVSNIVTQNIDVSNLTANLVIAEDVSSTRVKGEWITAVDISATDVDISALLTANDISAVDISAVNIHATNSLTVGGSDVALREATTFTHSDGGWITLARADTTTFRADALFSLKSRQSGRHHAVVFRAGGKYNNGIYMNVLSSSWYSGVVVEQLRIAYGSGSVVAGTGNGTYNGFVLQAKYPTDTSNNTQYLDVYQDTNVGGWGAIASGAVDPSENPIVYSAHASSGSGAYLSFKYTSDLTWDPEAQNSMATTTQDYRFTSALSMDASGADATLAPTNGKITLETAATSTVNTKDIDVLSCRNLRLHSGRTGPGYSYSLGDVDISAGNQVLITGQRSAQNTDPSVIIGVSGDTHGSTQMGEPFQLLTDTSGNIASRFNNVGSTSAQRQGLMAFSADGGPVAQIGDEIRLLQTSSHLSFIAYLKAREHATASSNAAQKIISSGSGQPYRFHMSNAGAGLVSGYLAAYGTTRQMYPMAIPSEMHIHSLTIYPYAAYANNPVISLGGTLGNAGTIRWEIWVATTTNTYVTDSVFSTNWFSNSWITNAGVPTTGPSVGSGSGIASNTQYTWEDDGCVCQKVSSTSLAVNGSSSGSIFNPWTAPQLGTGASAVPVTVYLGANRFTIPPNQRFSVYFVERADATAPSNILTVDFYGSGGNSYGEFNGATLDGVPIQVDLHGVSQTPIP